MNHMKEVATLLGVELYEEFKIMFSDGNISVCTYHLTNNSLEKIDEIGCVSFRDSVLVTLLNGTHTIIKIPKSILTEKEKKYLSDFIDPFKSQVTYIEKRYFKDFKGNEKEFISIGIKENEKYWRQMELPLYDAGKYYKGMNTSKHYTLEQLGL